MPEVSNPIDRLIGFGIIKPFQRDKKNDFASAGGARLLKSCVEQVLGTHAESEVGHGELPWRTNFGSKLYILKHRKGPAAKELARAFVNEALRRWEPRVATVQTQSSFDSEKRLVAVRVHFLPISENVSSNQVRSSALVADVQVA